MKKDNGENFTLGIDLGGTKIETALVDIDGHIVAFERIPTHAAKGPEGIFGEIIQSVKNCFYKAGKKAYGLGVGVAGQVEKGTGVVRFAPNLGWHEVPLQAKLEKALQIPAVINNDVRAATWGEWQYGAGRGVNDLLCLFIGTGVGGGIVSGGNLLEGCSNTAGELGHMTIIAGGRKCHCRNQGCLEAYAGGWAIKERAQEATGQNPQAGKKLIKLAGSLEKITAETVTEAYNQRDPLGSRLVEETADYLAAGIIGFVNAFNPCTIVIGGGVITGLPEYINMIERKVRERALEAAEEKLNFVTASLGDKAVVIGAAMLAYRKIQKTITPEHNLYSRLTKTAGKTLSK